MREVLDPSCDPSSPWYSPPIYTREYVIPSEGRTVKAARLSDWSLVLIYSNGEQHELTEEDSPWGSNPLGDAEYAAIHELEDILWGEDDDESAEFLGELFPFEFPKEEV